MSNKNEVFEYLIDQLRRQVDDNPYKQQCEDLAHEVQSLKNQLRDASAQIKELHKALATATGDVEAYKLIRKVSSHPSILVAVKKTFRGVSTNGNFTESGFHVCALNAG